MFHLQKHKHFQKKNKVFSKWKISENIFDKYLNYFFPPKEGFNHVNTFVN